MRAHILNLRKARLIIVPRSYSAEIIVIKDKKNTALELTESQLEELVSILQEILEEIEQRRIEEAKIREQKQKEGEE